MSVKSTWWSVTAFEEEISLCEGTLPEFVRAIYGGKEICPSTGKEHFQGALQCYEQIRMAKIKSWLKKAHLEPARSAEALKKYAMKPETSSGEKVIRTNIFPHYSAKDMCILLARQTDRQTTPNFWESANILLDNSPELAGQLMNPSLRGFYEKTYSTWRKHAEAIVLQPQLPCECGKDECEECYEREQNLLPEYNGNASSSS